MQVLIILLALLLSACGGGGDASEPIPMPKPEINVTITLKDPYDAFVFPDGTVVYRHELSKDERALTPEELEVAGVHVYAKDTPEWHHAVEGGKR